MAENTRLRFGLMEKITFGYRNFEREQAIKEGKTEGLAIGLAEGKAEGLAEGLSEGFMEGRAEGSARGARQRQLEIAERLKEEGLPTELICRTTGLGATEIERLHPVA